MRANLQVVVLAGGSSRRFGRDKATEPIRGRGSLDRVLEAAAPLGPIWLVGGPREEHPAIKGFVPDLESSGGPLQAIVAAMRKLGSCPILVLACDTPFIHSDLLRQITRTLEVDADARMPRIAGRAQPLLALYGESAQRHFEEAYSSGLRALHDVTSRLKVQWIEEKELTMLGMDPAQLGDFDGPEDLARLLAQNPGPEGRD